MSIVTPSNRHHCNVGTAGFVDGALSLARFSSILAMSADSVHNYLLISDQLAPTTSKSQNIIRRISFDSSGSSGGSSSGGYVTTVAGDNLGKHVCVMTDVYCIMSTYD